jgi:hypothetical protein
MNCVNTLQVTMSTAPLPVLSVGAVPPLHLTFSVLVPSPFGHVIVLGVLSCVILMAIDPVVGRFVVVIAVMFAPRASVPMLPALMSHVGVAVAASVWTVIFGLVRVLLVMVSVLVGVVTCVHASVPAPSDVVRAYPVVPPVLGSVRLHVPAAAAGCTVTVPLVLPESVIVPFVAPAVPIAMLGLAMEVVAVIVVPRMVEALLAPMVVPLMDPPVMMTALGR